MVVGEQTSLVLPAPRDDTETTTRQLLFDGASLTIRSSTERSGSAGHQVEYSIERPMGLADCVDDEMKVLLIGLNPSIVACELGYGFAGRSNRFWKAALASGLVSRRGDPGHTLATDHVGFTDLVKRPTARASELKGSEFSEGLARLDHLVELLEPEIVCVLGITGWRAATRNPRADLGLQDRHLGGRPVYVMPNPSGLNAHTNHDDLVEHMIRVQSLTH